MYKLYNLSKLIFHNIINYTIISNYKSIYYTVRGDFLADGEEIPLLKQNILMEEYA